MKIKAKSLLAMLLLLSGNASAELVYGVTNSSSSEFYEAANAEALWSGPYTSDTVYNMGTSSIGFGKYHEYFAADGLFYGINSDQELVSANSAADLLSGSNLTSYGRSSTGWSTGHQIFAHDGMYVGVSNNGGFYSSNSAIDLWNGIYDRYWGRSRAGWGNSHRYFYNSEGLYGVNGNNILYRYTSLSELVDGLPPEEVYGTSSMTWSLSNDYFSGGDTGEKIVATSNLKANDAPSPFALSALGLLGLGMITSRKKTP